MQNTSHAVMSQRVEPIDSPDDFPTPPWATRSLFEHVLFEQKDELTTLCCLEPACGAGHMAKVLEEYFVQVSAFDAYDYGYGRRQDFLKTEIAKDSVDWIVTNPPFRLAEEFVLRSLSIARCGVAILARTVFLESVGRHQAIFSDYPPTIFAQFVERVPMVKGRLDPKATTATGYAWFVWEKTKTSSPKLAWIPQCRRTLERENDYFSSLSKSERALPKASLTAETLVGV